MNIWIFLRNEVDDSGNKLLLILKILLRNLDVILFGDNEWLNEPQEFICDSFVVDDLMESDNSLADFVCHLPSLCEWQMLHQIRILIHGQYRKTHRLQRHGQEFHDIFLAVLIKIALVLPGTQPTTRFENLIDLITIFRITS